MQLCFITKFLPVFPTQLHMNEVCIRIANVGMSVSQMYHDTMSRYKKITSLISPITSLNIDK